MIHFRPSQIVALAAVLAATAQPLEVSAGEVRIGPRSLTVNVPVTSLREARFETVVQQRYDFSCGSAALATLLTYHYDRPTTEEEAFESMFAVGDKEAIKRKGFSLLDMKKYLQALGVRADGFRIGLAEIEKVRVPGIALVNTNGYLHFVVVKGVKGDEVIVGDPALGTRIMSREAFERIWQGVILMIRDKIEIAQANFNKDDDWAVRAKAPFGTAINRRSVSGFTLMLPRFDEL